MYCIIFSSVNTLFSSAEGIENKILAPLNKEWWKVLRGRDGDMALQLQKPIQKSHLLFAFDGLVNF